MMRSFSAPELPQVTLRADHLSHSFGFRPVLSEITLDVSQGEVLAVRGPNGSGKSTLLRLLAGLLRPSSGKTWIETPDGPLVEAERWQVTALAAPAIEPYHHLTLKENLEFVRTARGADNGQMQIEEIGEMVGLSDRLGDLAGTFSSGMLQRTRLALAWATSPGVLLLDEPSQCLDAVGREIVRKMVEAQRVRGACVIATNDEADAALADRCYWLKPRAKP